MRSVARGLLPALVLSAALAGPAAGHGGRPEGHPPHGLDGVRPSVDARVTLRSCFLTAVMMPRPAAVLQPVFRRPLDLSQTFYGMSPLLGVWGFDCEGARVAGRRAGPLRVSLVGVPVGLTNPGAAPLANNFAHALVRADTSSPELARALRRAGLPGRYTGMRYRHSPPATVPSQGRLAIPHGYTIAVRATALDPTNPHDHLNRFEHRNRDNSVSSLGFSSQGAVDRFCFPASGGCSATLRVPRGSPLRRLVGRRSAEVLVGFDHERLGLVVMDLSRERAPRPEK
jgi:hypothetical protein